MGRGPSQRAGARELREPGVESSERRPGAVPGGAPAVAAVAAAIGGWRSRAVGEQAAAFAREVVASAAAPTPARARALLFAAARLAAFGEQVGLEPRAEVLLHPSVIERFAVVGCGSVSPATRRTLRTNLRAVQPVPDAEPVALPRGRAKAPYRETEIAGYLALAAAQPTLARRMRAGALIGLGAGAGLVGAELRHLTGGHVVRRSGGLVVVVGGRRARAVPVLARFHEPLAAAAAFAGQGYLVGGRDAGRRNLSDALTAALCADAGLPRLEPGRLRATWLTECARRIGPRAFMQAAGIRCSQRLGDLLADLPALDEPELVALLGAADDRDRGTFAA